MGFELNLIIRDQRDVCISSLLVEIFEHPLELLCEGLPVKSTFLLCFSSTQFRFPHLQFTHTIFLKCLLFFATLASQLECFYLFIRTLNTFLIFNLLLHHLEEIHNFGLKVVILYQNIGVNQWV